MRIRNENKKAKNIANEYSEKMKILKFNYEKKINEMKNEYNILKDKYEKEINNKNIYKIKEYDNGRYEGEFKDDKFEGKGIYYFNSGSRYEGEFKNGEAEGKGIYYYNDGDR